MELLLSDEEVSEMVGILYSFYERVPTIQDYFLERKKEKVIGLNIDELSTCLFNDHTVQPKDMEIRVDLIDTSFLNTMAQIIISLPLESQIGRQICLGVKEMNTNKYLGFIKLASPVLTVRPRNEYFGTSPTPTQVNRHIVNGSIIVPTQPFGFNCLGGKLLALICGSNETRNMFNEKYGDKSDVVFMETTSLYGNIKGSSQYDGLEPYIKYQSMTESDLFLFPNDNIYFQLRNKLRPIYGKEEWGGSLVDPKPSGPKQREFTKIIGIIKQHLKPNIDEYTKFNNFTKSSMKSKTKKRYYYSTLGYSNVKEYVHSNGEIDLIKKPNYDNYSIERLIQYWKNKSQKRWEKLNSEDRLKTDLEVYSIDRIQNMTYDIIR